MRGATFGKLLTDFRSECRMSLNVAHNNQVEDQQKKLLQRVQEWLWDDFDWPHLRVKRTITLANGQRNYVVPTGLSIDRIEKLEVRESGVWCTMHPGIDAVHYAAFDSDTGQESWPVQRWQLTEDEEIEVWPIPDADGDTVTLEGLMQVTGIRNLNPLVATADTADLDDRLIVLFAAAEQLGDKGGQIKYDLATKRYAKMRGQLSKRRRFSMFGTRSEERTQRRIPFAIYRSS